MKELVKVGVDVSAITRVDDFLIWSRHKNGFELLDLKTNESFSATLQNGMLDISGMANDGTNLAIMLWETKNEPWTRNSIFQVNLRHLLENGKINSSVGVSPEISLPSQTRAIAYGQNCIFLGMWSELCKMTPDQGISFFGKELIGKDEWVSALHYDAQSGQLFAAILDKRVLVINPRKGISRVLNADLKDCTIMSLTAKDNYLFLGVCGTVEKPKGVLIIYDLEKNAIASKKEIPQKIFPIGMTFWNDDLLIGSNAPFPDQGGIANIGNPLEK